MRFNKYIQEIGRSELLYCLGISLYAVITIVRSGIVLPEAVSAVLEPRSSYIYYLAYLLCALGFCTSLFRGIYSRICFLVLLAAGSLLTFYGSGSSQPFYFFFFILCAAPFSGRRILHFSLAVKAVMLVLVVLFSQAGIIDDQMFDIDSRMRHGLGFQYATYGPVLFFFLLLCYIFIRREAMTLLEYVILAAAAFYLYKMTNSRMAFFMSVLVLVFFFLLCRLGKGLHHFLMKFRYLYYLIPLPFAGGSIAASYAYNDTASFWVKLNDLLSGRLQLQQKAIRTYDWTLFGQKIDWVGNVVRLQTGKEYNYVDNSYMHVGLENGLLYLALALLLYVVIMYRAWKADDLYLIWITIFIMTISLTEPRLLELTYNPFPLLAFADLRYLEKHDFALTVLWKADLRAVNRRDY